MAILKLAPSFKDYIWGGRRLIEEYHKPYDGDILAESWEVSCHPDGPSFVTNGAYAGKTLQEYIDLAGREVLGTNCRRFDEFPVLIKFIDAKDNLSIQVHPDNAYALKYEHQYGKTEMWYVVDCEEGAYLYYGFNREVSKEEFAERIKNNTLLEVLNPVKVKKGDVLFIESGTIHAIGKNILIAEIQQNSNVTYRVYDYGRIGKDGKPRELHVEKALEVTRREPVRPRENCAPHVAACDYFVVDKLSAKNEKLTGFVGKESFQSILVMEGEGEIVNGEEKLTFKKGDSLFLPADSGAYEISGTFEALVTSEGAKKNPLRIGIDMGGTSIKIGVVNEKNEIIARTVLETRLDIVPEELIANMGKVTRKLLEDSNIPLDQCVGVGIGSPGTIDDENGVVIYSNNYAWENVPLRAELKKYLPLPIYINNDANCAMLGETAAGAAAGRKNVVFLTLGTGVGGGFLIDGKLFNGGLLGGTEFGHTVVQVGGVRCTCGREGCLESYASATGLIRMAREQMEKHPDSLLWKLCDGDKSKVNAELAFKASDEKDEAGMLAVKEYMKYLAAGIANAINMFRPEVVVLGGGISNRGEKLAEELNEMVKDECFGHTFVKPAKVVIATLKNDAGIIGAAELC